MNNKELVQKLLPTLFLALKAEMRSAQFWFKEWEKNKDGSALKNALVASAKVDGAFRMSRNVLISLGPEVKDETDSFFQEALKITEEAARIFDELTSTYIRVGTTP